MRTTLNIDDQLLDDAQRITGITEKTSLVREGLRALSRSWRTRPAVSPIRHDSGRYLSVDRPPARR